MRKNLAQSDVHARASRKRFAGLLWRAFPASSERDLAAKAAPVLGVSERQVRNWLQCENDAALRHVFAVTPVDEARVRVTGQGDLFDEILKTLDGAD
ncbi:hypothetical protein [Cereibacter johrii]|uniref:hypothetical protein n=1 Tax=Cereibacter johrii TaxID=445629 RepID=UPI003CEF7BFE